MEALWSLLYAYGLVGLGLLFARLPNVIVAVRLNARQLAGGNSMRGAVVGGSIVAALLAAVGWPVILLQNLTVALRGTDETSAVAFNVVDENGEGRWRVLTELETCAVCGREKPYLHLASEGEDDLFGLPDGWLETRASEPVCSVSCALRLPPQHAAPTEEEEDNG